MAPSCLFAPLSAMSPACLSRMGLADPREEPDEPLARSHAAGGEPPGKSLSAGAVDSVGQASHQERTS